MTFATTVLGLVAAIVAAMAATRRASSRGLRPAVAYGICGFIMAALVYGAVLQLLVLYVHARGSVAATIGPETIFSLFALSAAVAAVAIGAGLVSAWIALIGRSGQQAPRPYKTFGLALLFSLSITILAAPFLVQNQLTIERSISASEAEILAFQASYKNGLERLTKLGALDRIEVADDAVTHYIGNPLYKVGAKGLAEYARAAMIYHTHILGNPPKRIVLRDSTTESEIGTYRTDGVFVIRPAGETLVSR